MSLLDLLAPLLISSAVDPVDAACVALAFWTGMVEVEHAGDPFEVNLLSCALKAESSVAIS